jgi:hypothetical protein
MNGPVDIFIDQGLNFPELALVDRAMQCARETPEAMLCHFRSFLNWLEHDPEKWEPVFEKDPARLKETANRPFGVLDDAGAVAVSHSAIGR